MASTGRLEKDDEKKKEDSKIPNEQGGEKKRKVILNPDLIENILSRLPVKSLFRTRCLSKHFSSLIQQPFFIEKHLHNTAGHPSNHRSILLTKSTGVLYSIPEGDQFHEASYIGGNINGGDIVGSSHGILCLSVARGRNLLFFNHATRDTIQIPNPHFGANLGFGYNETIRDVEVVSLMPKDSKNEIEVGLYTSSTNSWRSLGLFSPYNVADVWNGYGCLLHGLLHWVGQGDDDFYIISYNMATHTLHKFPLPNNPKLGSMKNIRFRVFRGLLHLFLELDMCIHEIWVMNDYNFKDSWEKLCKIGPERRIVWPQTFLKNGEIFSEKKKGLLVSYKWETGVITDIHVPRYPRKGRGNVDLVPYVDTLVPPKKDIPNDTSNQEEDLGD